MKTRVFQTTQYPWRPEWVEEAFLIYDRKLEKNPQTQKWIRQFPQRWGVRAGEQLKDAGNLQHSLSLFAKKTAKIPSRKLKVIAVGGGSVGDFAGFMASIYKRGVGLIQIPSTWLAAFDSAHGGKNGLNFQQTKNQVGTFYPAHEVILVKALLLSQPKARAHEVAGEILKLALLKGGKLWSLSKDPKLREHATLWKILPAFIDGKLSIVKQDPIEEKGLRHLLNLGHTFGHVIEAELRIPHGIAVLYGLAFALVFSREQGYCSNSNYEKMISHPLWAHYLPSRLYLQSLSLSKTQIQKRLQQDKKRDQALQIRFIFLKATGHPVIHSIPISKILKEVARQRQLLKEWND